MAGFSYIGEPNQQIAPPRVRSYGTPGFSNLSVPNQPTNYAGFLSGPDIGNIGADSSSLHLGNVALARSGLGNTGANYGSASDSGYGFTGQDVNDINSFMTNPQSTQTANPYKALTQRLRNPFSNTGQFNSYAPDQYDKMLTNFPQTWGNSYNQIPPPTFQNIGIPLAPGTSGFRY